jgi:flavin-dependent dehydrogenase
MFNKRDFFFGIQARVRGNYDPAAYETYFGSICPGFFAWILPESKKMARIGVITRKDTKETFNRFLKLKKINKKQIVDLQAGLIPIFNKKTQVQKGNIFLVGDAASQVKATTGGGLVPGLKAAKILSECILRHKNYKKELQKINKELWLHLKIRCFLDNFSDKDYNELIELMKDKKIMQALKDHNRDNPKRLLFKILSSRPSLLFHTITKIFPKR